MFFIDDFVLVELGLGGKPALVELGLEEILILVEVGMLVAKVLAGICKERFGRRELCPGVVCALPSWSSTYRIKQTIQSETDVSIS